MYISLTINVDLSPHYLPLKKWNNILAYSLLNDSTGFVFAALHDNVLTESQAIANTASPDMAKTETPIVMWSVKCSSHLLTTQ